MAGYRIDRISEEVKKEIDRVVREELHDPRIRGTYTITRADVTRDLRYAKVYVSTLEPEYADGVLAALKSAAGFIRRQIGHRLALRYTPELLFQADHNIAYGIHMAQVIRDVTKDEERNSEQTEDDTP